MNRSLGTATAMLVILAVAVSARPASSQEVNPPLPRTDKGLYLQKVVEPGYDITVTEVERGARHSTIEIVGVVPTVAAGGIVMFKAVYDIAVERGFEYTFSTSRPLPSNETGTVPSGGRFVSIRAQVFFTNDANVALKDLLGDAHDERAQQMFDRIGYQSVTQLQLLFGGR
jgi:hypothetical protein